LAVGLAVVGFVVLGLLGLGFAVAVAVGVGVLCPPGCDGVPEQALSTSKPGARTAITIRLSAFIAESSLPL